MKQKPHPWDQYLGARLALLGWSRAELARRCGVTPAAVAKAAQKRAFSPKLARAAQHVTSGLLRATILAGLEDPPEDPFEGAA